MNDSSQWSSSLQKLKQKPLGIGTALQLFRCHPKKNRQIRRIVTMDLGLGDQKSQCRKLLSVRRQLAGFGL